MDGTVYLDYRDRASVAAMTIGGMSVVERMLREAARAGAERVVVRGDDLPHLPVLPVEVSVIPASGELPEGATAIPADVIAGVRVTDEQTRRAASRALFQTCRRPYDGLGDRYVIRGISLRLSSLLCRLGATPNQVTFVNVAIGFAACVFAARGALRVAGALMFLQVVLDSCDGELARIRHLHSRFGMWLDNTSDDVIDTLFLAMLGVGIGGIWQPIGIAAACARAFTSIVIHVDVARQGKLGDVLAFKWWFDTADEQLAERFETGTSIIGLGRATGRRDFYVLLWALTCVAGIAFVGLAASLVINAVYFALMLVHLVVARSR